MTSTKYDLGGSRGLPSRSSATTRTGWSVFGGIMLLVIGAANAIQGLTALQYDEFLTTDIVLDNLTFWGWAFLVWGVLQAISGVLTLVGNDTGPSMGVTVASIGAVGWFFLIFAAPAAAAVGIGISVAIVASLATAFAE